MVALTKRMSEFRMNVYGSANSGLSPDLDRRAQGWLLFTNHYSHAVAAFRGLHRQLNGATSKSADS